MSLSNVVNRAAAGLVCRPARLLWLAPLIMALEGPGCVVAENSLTRPASGIVDEAILGDWAYSDTPGKIAVRVSQRDDRTIEVHWFVEESGEYIVLTGFVSEVNGRTHANLQFVGAGCQDCSDEAAAIFERTFERDFAAVVSSNSDNECTWATVSYAHLSNDQLLISTLSPRAVLELIDAGELQGTFDRDAEGSYASRVVCITESRRGLRRFVEELDIEGPVADSEILVRYVD